MPPVAHPSTVAVLPPAPTPPTARVGDRRGPTLFEDNAEFGFGMSLAVKSRREQLAELVKQALPRGLDAELEGALAYGWKTKMMLAPARQATPLRHCSSLGEADGAWALPGSNCRHSNDLCRPCGSLAVTVGLMISGTAD